MHKNKKWTDDKCRQLVKMREDGIGWKDIASKLGVSEGSASQALTKFRAAQKKAPKVKKLSAPNPTSPVIFEVPDVTPKGQVAILIVPISQVKEVMASLWQ